MNDVVYIAGDIRQGQPEDFLSKAIETEYLGLDQPCIDVEQFFHAIFDDQQVEEYVQRLLGCGITGHTREQIFPMMTGAGSNGKVKFFQPFPSSFLSQLA